ncbi:MAG: OmpH family outer membrane protein [Planctomycetaceae bacterium]|jgi:Skp family chaperone for outer membrane proteins|nr:OmpH family outer membrane protein [Planctomycetaceae bacterium]
MPAELAAVTEILSVNSLKLPFTKKWRVKKVKRTNWIPLVVVLVLGFAGVVSSVANAQTGAAAAQPQPRPYQVAVVDIAQLIKNHPDFTAKQEELQKFAKNKEVEFEARKQKIQEREQTLSGLKLTPGTPDHDRAVAEITTLVTDLDKDVKIAQRKVMTENSIILHNVYKEIRDEIGVVAKAGRIAQVMDYRPIEATPADQNSVAAMLEQSLIWHDDNLDISQYIVQRLYQKRQIAKIPDLKALREEEKAKALTDNLNRKESRTANSTVGGTGNTTVTPTGPR